MRVSGLLAVLIATLLSTRPVSADLFRPNILLIIADDLCWRDLGCTGNPDVRTPNIDSLAAKGMSLRGMFTTSPTCSPCRHELFTGLYPIRSGAYPNHTMVDAGTGSLFTYLKRAGYRVGLQGKKHISPASSFPFEYLGADPDDPQTLRDFIEKGKSQPWMAVFASHDPHAPWTRGKVDQIDPARLKVPEYLHDNATTRRNLAAYYAEIGQLDQQVGACLKTVRETGQLNKTLVMFVSEQGNPFPYGGKWSLQDNGVHVAAFVRWPGVIEPGSVSDALMQYVDITPTLVEVAGMNPEKIDTGCADANGERGFDGRTILPVLRGRPEHRKYVFGQHTAVGVHGYKEPYPIRSVRDARYKLIRNLLPENTYWITHLHGTEVMESWETDAKQDAKLQRRVDYLSHRPAEELYDLRSDPLETHNLAHDDQHSDVKHRLGEQLDAWMTQQGDRGVATELKAPSRQPGR